MRIKKTDIRKAELLDASMLNFLFRQCFSDVVRRFGLTPENFPGHPLNSSVENFQKDLSRGVFFFIKIDRGIPAGYIGLEPFSLEHCDIVQLGVLPGRRRRGFGTELVEKAILEAKNVSAKHVGSAIIAEDTELKSWYKKLGFFEIETRRENHLPFRVTLMQVPL
ncbi:MAG: GNAT family N-acetyltransferase [Desulfobacterales bacterium]